MIAIHINPRNKNQVNYGDALAAGFRAHGEKFNLTADINAKADMHCIIGPFYAYNQYKTHDKVLYLDRAYWDHPEYTSVNWLRNGDKVWNWGINKKPRYHPIIKPWRKGRKLIILCDYGEDGTQYVNYVKNHYNFYIRRHPADKAEQIGLMEELKDYDLAMGGRSTALVTASIEGLSVFSTIKSSPAYPISKPLSWTYKPDRAAWLKDLSWHNWKHSEIQSGELWHHLRQ